MTAKLAGSHAIEDAVLSYVASLNEVWHREVPLWEVAKRLGLPTTADRMTAETLELFAGLIQQGHLVVVKGGVAVPRR